MMFCSTLSRVFSTPVRITAAILGICKAESSTNFVDVLLNSVETIIEVVPDAHVFPYNVVVQMLDYLRSHPEYVEFSEYPRLKTELHEKATSNSSPILKEYALTYVISISSSVGFIFGFSWTLKVTQSI
jgi:hypothetical protein